MKVIPNNDKDSAVAVIIEAMMNSFIKEHPGLEDDIRNLAMEIVMFNAKWGTQLNINELIKINKK